MNSERRFDAGAWVTLAIAIGWAVVLLGGALFALYLPSDGWAATGPDRATGTFTFATDLTGSRTRLKTGDILLAIDVQPLSAERAPQLPPHLEAGQTLQYTVERGREILEVEVVLVRPGVAGLGRDLAGRWQSNPRDYIVATLSLLVIGLAFWLRPGNLGARYLLLIFSFYCFGTYLGYAVSSLYVYSFPLPLALLYNLTGPWAWGWYFFSSVTLMALAFPVVKAPLRRFPRLLPALLYGLPLALTAAANYAALSTGAYHWLDLLQPVLFIGMLMTIATIFGALLHNWRTLRDPVARAQLRWLTLGLGAGLGLMFSLFLLAVLLYGSLPTAWNNTLWLLILLPISLAIAITRYRLFDIDVIIRRTLIYSALSAVLALAYFGSVLVLENLSRLFTGQGQNSLVVVLSTLAIAALFVPLRARVQRAIDRRFFRQKYDVARTLAGFAAGTRDETDLGRLSAHLVQVVDETMQPASVGLWLKPASKTKGPPR